MGTGRNLLQDVSKMVAQAEAEAAVPNFDQPRHYWLRQRCYHETRLVGHSYTAMAMAVGQATAAEVLFLTLGTDRPHCSDQERSLKRELERKQAQRK